MFSHEQNESSEFFPVAKHQKDDGRLNVIRINSVIVIWGVAQ